MAEHQHGGLRVMADGVLKAVVPAVGRVGVGMGNEHPITRGYGGARCDLLAAPGCGTDDGLADVIK